MFCSFYCVYCVFVLVFMGVKGRVILYYFLGITKKNVWWMCGGIVGKNS